MWCRILWHLSVKWQIANCKIGISSLELSVRVCVCVSNLFTETVFYRVQRDKIS